MGGQKFFCELEALPCELIRFIQFFELASYDWVNKPACRLHMITFASIWSQWNIFHFLWFPIMQNIRILCLIPNIHELWVVFQFEPWAEKFRLWPEIFCFLELWQFLSSAVSILMWVASIGPLCHIDVTFAMQDANPTHIFVTFFELFMTESRLQDGQRACLNFPSYSVLTYLNKRSPFCSLSMIKSSDAAIHTFAITTYLDEVNERLQDTFNEILALLAGSNATIANACWCLVVACGWIVLRR